MLDHTDLHERISRAKELLDIHIARHAAMATVNDDGSPHNTPFHLVLDPNLRYVYFGSDHEARHTKNVVRTGQMFVVVYDALKRGGLYIEARNGRQLNGTELAEGLKLLNDIRIREGKQPVPEDYYTAANPQGMYRADITHMWVNVEERDANGLIQREYRHEISAKDLLAHD